MADRSPTEAVWTSEIGRFDACVYATLGNHKLVIELAIGNNPRVVNQVKQHLDKDFMVLDPLPVRRYSGGSEAEIGGDRFTQ